VGISADKPATQLKFVEKFGLTFPVIPDTEKDIIDAYGAREVLGVTAKRTTFLIGPDGTIRRIWRNVKVEGHAEEVLSTIRTLRAEEAER
jgi:thioredoxin-dependent peroxiredoxin